MDLDLRALVQATRLLPAATARNAREERERLVRQLVAGRIAEPRWELRPPRSVLAELRRLDRLRREAALLPCAALYGPRLDELELELCLMSHLGSPKQLRPLSARRFGTGAVQVEICGQKRTVAQVARAILDRIATDEDPKVVPAVAEGPGQESLAAVMRRCIDGVGLSARVVLEPALVAGAATGDRTVYLAARSFGVRETERLAVHEVLGHLTAAANGRAQPIRLLEWGTADSFTDQEGLALYLEDAHGLLDRRRLRTLAGRVVATDAMHADASFTETSRLLHRDEGFPAEEAVILTERAYRGGGIARDVSYLIGFLRVLAAFEQGSADVDALRAGRLSLSAVRFLPQLRQQGLARPAIYRPNLARSLFSTISGTTPCRLPPKAAASLIKLELT